MTVRYPNGYGTQRLTMAELRAKHEPKMHPEFARRLFNWIESKGGHIGIGGGWRDSQPSLPGFAPEGRSFHQYQLFGSNNYYAAVDLVAINPGAKHRSPYWSEVPEQGSADARKWGVHCNIGVPGGSWPSSEPWHMQPIEIDGWASWYNAGRPDIQWGYPIPGSTPEPEPEPNPPIPTLPPIYGEFMNSLVVHNGVRLYDSRDHGNRRKGTVDITPAENTPADAEALALNVTVFDATQGGYAAVWDGVGLSPEMSVVNYKAKGQENGFTLVPIGEDGKFSIFLTGTAHFVVDQVAYIENVD